MFNAEGKLNIFESFRVDRKLPKYAKQDSSVIDLSVQSSSVIRWASQDDSSSDDSSERLAALKVVRKESRWSRLKRFFARAPKPPAEMSIVEFFSSIKNSTQELYEIKELALGYENAIRRAVRGGQTALVEQLQKMLMAARGEAQLIALGLPKYLDEETVVEFVKKAKKGLRLDWVANFTRMIPEELLRLKFQADERGIFDNYVVLHYDPDKKSWAETEAERASREDPILFGVMEGRRRLYYIGDWVDEFCDLTMDQIAETLGRQPDDLNKQMVA